MDKPDDMEGGMTNDRVAVESIACILRHLVDRGAISLDVARATMADSLPTLGDSSLRNLWAAATEAFASGDELVRPRF
ncbi:hypothetical protein SAMN05444678_102299 [Sphingomonas sp. YR710]|jgi:hypothetical protein|uniref:hypothetical protein n=1 Tax=Sphingomonas sp. YR710 TaxID=1882773 RepID=UPI000883E49D|nr:hypothetical protein [Sphingomonas sp. YR710]SDC32165.1 hypothetical protein SAMN05444678_102299 [Sphingomonas sp. YR710]